MMIDQLHSGLIPYCIEQINLFIKMPPPIYKISIPGIPFDTLYFPIPQLSKIPKLDDVFVVEYSIYKVATSSLLFYLYSRFAKGMIHYVTLVVQYIRFQHANVHRGPGFDCWPCLGQIIINTF